MPRLFVAIEPPAEVIRLLLGLRGGVANARFVREGQVHLTLRFVGSVDEPEALRIRTALRDLRVTPFALHVAGVGVFPGPRSGQARVLWAGVAPVEPLRTLKNAVDERLGPDPEAARGFHPHLTLARLTPPAEPDLAEFLARHANLASPPWQVDTLAVFSGDTRPEGAVHTRLPWP